MARHVAVLRFLRVWHDGAAAALFNALESHRAIRARPRQHDRDGALTMRLGKRAEEDVDGRAAHLYARPVRDFEIPVLALKTLVRRNHVDVIGHDACASLDLRDRHACRALEHGRQLAVVVGREVQDDDVSHTALGGHTREEVRDHGEDGRRALELYPRL